MTLTMKVTYILEINTAEYRLISAALRGTLKEEWKEDALDLQSRLFQARNKEIKTKADNILKTQEED